MAETARWEHGRASIDALVAEGRLQRIHPNKELAELMVAQALVHLQSARTVAAVDPVGSFQLTYDATHVLPTMPVF